MVTHIVEAAPENSQPSNVMHSKNKVENCTSQLHLFETKTQPEKPSNPALQLQLVLIVVFCCLTASTTTIVNLTDVELRVETCELMN